MTITTVFWAADTCVDCGSDVREITLTESIDGEVVETVILECSSAACLSRGHDAHLLAA